MKGRIIDISQEVFTCCVYPGDPSPEQKRLAGIENGDGYNLTWFSMCAHNGTHIDAPYHFLSDGETVDKLGLEPFVGDCFVARCKGELSGDDARDIMDKAVKAGAGERILIAGNAVVTAPAARVFAEHGIRLIGNESQSVGPDSAPAEVHKVLLSWGIVLLEGIRLGDIDEGKYFLNAAPLNLGGADGAPCRAYLIEE